MAAIASTAATGTANPAWSSRRSSRHSVIAIAIGITTTASRPRTTETAAARFRGLSAATLLLDVWTAIGGWRDRAADQAGDRDQGQDVGNGRDQVGGDVRFTLERPCEREPEAEEQRGDERPARPPLAEDDRGERDEAAPGGHVLLERPR